LEPQVNLTPLTFVGAGKTTLLNYLVNKDPSKNLKKSGEILLNGKDRNHVHFSHYIGYVQQDDILLQSMTVKECLMFSAKMKLPPSVDKEERVQELMDSLKLNK
jgi:ABC-type multidrug transport system ATPase subunit